jgi:glycosyl transferase, family 25
LTQAPDAAAPVPGNHMACPAICLLEAARAFCYRRRMAANLNVYLINLDRDIARFEFVHRQLNNLEIEYQRFSAIQGSEIAEWQRKYFYNQDGSLASQLSLGEIGCYASHLALMQRVIEDDAPALILEDDIEIKPEFPDLLPAILSLGHNWDILRISSRRKGAKIKVASLPGGYRAVKYLHVPPNTGAYIIKPSGARKFLDWLTPRWRPVDQDLRRVWETRLLTIGIDPQPIIQNVLPSSINAIGGKIVGRKKYARDAKWSDDVRRVLYNTGYMFSR